MDNIAPTVTNVMEYVTMASSGNAVDGGDLTIATGVRPGSVANSIRGIVAGGNNPSQTKTLFIIQYRQQVLYKILVI